MNKKMFVFDLSGIILEDSNQIDEKIIKKIKEIYELGNFIVIISRRPFEEIKQKLIPIYSYINYFIGLNGAIIIDLKEKNKMRTSKTIDLKTLKSIENDVKELSGLFLGYTSSKSYLSNYRFINEEGHYSSNIINFENQGFEKFDSRDVKNNNFFLQISIELNLDKIEIFKNFLRDYYGNNFTFTIVENKIIDINVNGVSKYNSLLKLLKINNVKPQNVFIFGNSISSLKIIERFNNTYVSEKNKNEEIKSKAQKIMTGDNSETISFEITSILNNQEI